MVIDQPNRCMGEQSLEWLHSGWFLGNKIFASGTKVIGKVGEIHIPVVQITQTALKAAFGKGHVFGFKMFDDFIFTAGFPPQILAMPAF